MEGEQFKHNKVQALLWLEFLLDLFFYWGLLRKVALSLIFAPALSGVTNTQNLHTANAVSWKKSVQPNLMLHTLTAIFLRTILHLFSLHAYLPNADIPFVHNRSTQLVLLSSCDLLFFCKWYPQTPSVKTIFNSDHQLVQVSRWSRYQFPTFLLLLLFWFFCQCFVCLVVVFTILFQWKKQTSNFARLQSLAQQRMGHIVGYCSQASLYSWQV